MRRPLIAILSLLALVALIPSASALEVWPNRTFSFSKPAFGDPTLPANQDRITDQVWITRGNTMGIYNIAQEGSYTQSLSPVGTEWATGEALDFGSLTFQSWQDWANNNPPSTVGVNAVVHLIDEDIYIDIVFDSWGSSAGSGGFFSYRRGVPPVVPTAPSTWGRVKRLYR